MKTLQFAGTEIVLSNVPGSGIARIEMIRAAPLGFDPDRSIFYRQVDLTLLPPKQYWVPELDRRRHLRTC